MRFSTSFILFAIALVATSVCLAGPVGPAPMSGIDGQNQVQSPATYEATPYPIWERQLPGGVWVTPLVDDDGNIYVPTNDGQHTYVALDTNGSTLWTLGTGQSWGLDSQGCLGETGGNVYWYVPVRYDDNSGEIWKIDTASGNVIWTVDIPQENGRDPDMWGSRMKMDAAGDMYVGTSNSGYVYKITDLGASGSIVWGAYTGHTGLAELALSPEEDAVYESNIWDSLADPDRQVLLKLSTADGSVVWSVAFTSQTTPPEFTSVGGFPVVDDNGDIYLFFEGNDDTSNFQAMAKFSAADGSKIWETPEVTGWYNTWDRGQNGMAFNLDQTRIYEFVQTRLFALDTATGEILWTSQDFSMGNWNVGSGSYPLIGPTGKYYLGGLYWGASDVFRFTDNGSDCSLDWASLTGAQSSYHGGLAQDNNSDLIVPSTDNGGCSKLYSDGPPLAIVWPQALGPLEKDIPVYGDKGVGKGYKLSVKGAQGPVTFSVASGAFPPGVFVTEDGWVRGMPTAIGQYTVEVQADDTVTTATRSYVIDVNMAPLQIGPGLPLASVGTPYSGALWIIGGTPPYTVTVTAGKGDGGTGDGTLGTTGLTLAADGTITGTPTIISSASVEITVLDSGFESIVHDITVDVVDTRVWDTFQRTKRRVGTSTLPAPVSYPHNMGNYDPGNTYLGRTWQYNSADTWTWTYEMACAPLFANLESDADGDGQNDGYMFIYNRFYGIPYSYGDTYGHAVRIAAPYDVDPGPFTSWNPALPPGIYPDAVEAGGWVFDATTAQMSGPSHWWPGQLSLKDDKLTADRLYWSNDASGLPSRFMCNDANTGALLWSIPGEDPWTKVEKGGTIALLENGDLVDVVGDWEYITFEQADPPQYGVWKTELSWWGTWGWSRTYGVIRDNGSTGEVIWTAGEENTWARAGMGPIFDSPGGLEYQGALTVFKLADEGELVLAERREPWPYYVGRAYALRADKPQQYTAWTIGIGGDTNGWGWWAASTNACAVVDSTNYVYVTKTHPRTYGDPEYQQPGLWCVDAVDALTNVYQQPNVPGEYDWRWPYIHSDNALRWMTALVDSEYHRIPASPCLSYDQRTIYTIAMPRSVSVSGQPAHLHPGTKAKLFALHTINGAIKWEKDLEIDGLSGLDNVESDEHKVVTFAPLADVDGKVLCYTNGDRRQWWRTPGDPENPQGPEFDGLLRPMVWCFKDNCSDDATLLWTRAMGRWQYLDWGGPASFAVTPNYRLLMPGNLDPEWIVAGRISGWGSLNPYYVTGVHIIHPDDIEITDVYWDQVAKNVVLTFTTQNGVDYTVEEAEAAAYEDAVAWSDLTTVTAAGDSTTVTDNLTANPLTEKFRFYRVRRTVSDPFYSNNTVGVFELSLAALPALKFIGTPLVPDPDHNSVKEIFGEGAARQVPRTGFQISDLNETTGVVTRMTYTIASPNVFTVTGGAAFNLAPAVGHKVVMGSGPPLTYKVRLTGYVWPRVVLADMTKVGTQSQRWFAYSLAKGTTLVQLGLETAVTPWFATNEVRLLQPGSSAWDRYQYKTTVPKYWYKVGAPGTPVDPPISAGLGVLFIRQGPPDATDMLPEVPWYLRPPNDW